MLWLTTPGTYQLNATVKIKDSTDLECAPGVTIQRIGDEFNLLETEKYSATAATATLTWSSGYSVTMTWTNHGRAVGDPVSVEGTTQSYFNGVFLVESVPTANTLTYKTVRLPLTGPTGTTKVRVANKNIKIFGCTFDANYPTYSGTSLNQSALVIGHAYNVRLTDIITLNAQQYGVNAGAVRDLVVTNITANTAKDIIKVYGPAYGTKVDGVYGIAADDMVSFQTKEAPAFSAYIWTFGDVIGARASNIYATTGATNGNVAAAYFSTDEYMDQVHFDGLYGNTAPGTGRLLTTEGILSTDVVGLITARNLGGHGAEAVHIQTGTYARVVIENMTANGESTNASMVVVASDATVYQLNLKGYSTPQFNAWNAGNALQPCIIFGIARVVTLEDMMARQLVSAQFLRLITLVTGSTVNQIDIINPYVETSDDIVAIQTGVLGTPHISITGGYLDALGGIYSNGSNFRASFNHVKLLSMSEGVVSSDGTPTITVDGTGNELSGGSAAWVHVYTGTPVINFKTFDVQDDVGATYVARATGNYMYNTNAARGTLGAAGPVVSQGTGAGSWHLQANPVLVY